MDKDGEIGPRQRLLEKEVMTLKDTIWRLTSRLCVVESFLKAKYAFNLPNTEMTFTATPVVQVNNNSNSIAIRRSENSNIVRHNHNQVTLNSSEGPASNNNDGTNSIVDMEEDHNQHDHQVLINTEVQSAVIETTPRSATTTTTVTLSDIRTPSTPTSPGKDDPLSSESTIRIYKPDLKTFVIVKADNHLATHISTNNDNDSSKSSSSADLQCKVCHKKFTSKENAQRHVLLHRSVQYRCNECARTFSHQGNLKTHMQKHERVKQQAAENEQRLKSTKPTVQTDLENRKHPCSFCEKKFYTQQQMKIHTRIHTGEKPYGCTICGMRFNQKASLADHSLGHTGEKSNYCHICPAGFVRSRNLLKHIRQVHKMVQIKTVVNGKRVVEFVAASEAAAIIESRKDNVEIKSRNRKPRIKKQARVNVNRTSTSTTDDNNSTSATTADLGRSRRATAGKRPRKYNDDGGDDNVNGTRGRDEKYIIS